MTCRMLFLALMWVATPAVVWSQIAPSTPPDVVFDRALAALKAGKYAAAAAELQELKRQFPEDLIIRSKLIVAFEGMGHAGERDRERADLVKLRATSRDPRVREVEVFERDRFQVADLPVASFEYFDFVGERPVRYSFVVLNATGDTIQRRITLGSSESTTRFMRQTGQLPPDERAFHLDENTDSSHITWAMFLKEPSYEEVKARVIAILKGESQPLSKPDVAAAR